MATVIRSAAPAAAVDRRALVDELVRLLPGLRHRYFSAVSAAVEDEVGSATPHQMEALHLLHLTIGDGAAQESRGATMNELARRQHCALSTATALVDRLLRQGLAERVADPADRRVVRIVPTAKGRALQERFGDVKRTVALDALSTLSDSELEMLVALLRKVVGGAGADNGVKEVAHD
ncbi:MAG: MarR family winged helix-turn-helix transcriptional regulator [Candidatus Dormibacteria bacterium]